MHIGKHIQEVMLAKNRTARWLAEQIPCERTNVYKLFKRSSLDTDMLVRLSVVLEHDFMKDLSDEVFGQNECEK